MSCERNLPERMRDRGVIKTPDCGWIDMNIIVHEF